jgi:hypothetical protein
MYKTFALLAGLIALSNGSSTKSLRVRSFLQQRGDSTQNNLPKDLFAFDADNHTHSEPHFGEANETDFDVTDLGNDDFDFYGEDDLDGTDFDGEDDFNGTDFDGEDDFDGEYEWVDPKLPSEYYTYGDLLDEIIDSAEDVVDTATDLKRLQERLVSRNDDIRLALISVALDDDETAFDVLSDIEECVEDEEVYDNSDDEKIWGIVNSCWNVRPEEFAANLLAYNAYWVLYAVDACHGVDVEYKEVIGTFYQNPEDEFQEAVEHEVDEGTDNTVLLSLKDFATSKISKINLLQQAPREERDEEDIVNELETLYSDVVEEVYRSCYEAYELRNELRDNLFEAYYPATHLPYPDEEPTDEVLEAYDEVLSE